MHLGHVHNQVEAPSTDERPRSLVAVFANVKLDLVILSSSPASSPSSILHLRLQWQCYYHWPSKGRVLPEVLHLAIWPGGASSRLAQRVFVDLLRSDPRKN